MAQEMRVLRGSSLWLLCVVCVASFQLCCAASLRARLRSGHGDDLRVFIASFPATHNILYSTVPSADQELVWKPLVEEGVVQKPTALVCDKYRKKLYVADGSSATIVSFEMVLQEDQSISLIDETPTTVAEHMNVVGLTVGANGDLYVSGLLSGASDTMGIFKFSAVYLQAGTLQVPETLWTQANSWTQPSVPLYNLGGPVAVSNNVVYWGNLQGGSRHASLVRASTYVPQLHAATSLNPMAANVEQTTCITLTPTAVFYATKNAIYGVSRTKIGSSCEGSHCVLVSQDAAFPTAMVWDEDGFIYVADYTAGRIKKFASSGIRHHAMHDVGAASSIFGLTMLVQSGR